MVALVGLSIAVPLLAGCASPGSSTVTADTPTVRTNELADAAGQPCPQELPIGDDPSGHGFGTEEAAAGLPALLEPHEAWVCQYVTVDVGTTSAGGSVYGWRRAGVPEPVVGADLPDLQAALDDLEPADRGRSCTDDLGPRWMVAYSHGGDLTGVVVDDFGCRAVRLTDNPHATPPGADGQDGAVGGVLQDGAAILDVIGVGRPN